MPFPSKIGPFSGYGPLDYPPWGPLTRRIRFSPTSIPGLAAWYDINDLSSMVYDGSNRVQLIADKSGNSGTNVLCLNGVAGNYASLPDSAALDITGDIDLRAFVAYPIFPPSSTSSILGKLNTGTNQASYLLRLSSTGAIILLLSANGSILNTATSSAVISPGSGSVWVRATWRQSDGRVQFFTSNDGSNWTQVGTDQSIVIASIFSSSAIVEIGANNVGIAGLNPINVYRAQIYSGINGTLALDANFTAQSKLVTSFTESSSNAATVTINSTGDQGARICGARDLVNMTAANQPVLTISASGNYITGDGTNDDMGCAPFSLAQPITSFFGGSQVSWASGDYIHDGGSSNTLALAQTTSTPRVSISAGSTTAENSGWAVGTRAIITSTFSGASSALQVNLGTATTGNAGTGAPNGLSLFSLGGAANFGNATMSEWLVYSSAIDAAAKERVIRYLAQHNQIVLP